MKKQLSRKSAKIFLGTGLSFPRGISQVPGVAIPARVRVPAHVYRITQICSQHLTALLVWRHFDECLTFISECLST